MRLIYDISDSDDNLSIKHKKETSEELREPCKFPRKSRNTPKPKLKYESDDIPENKCVTLVLVDNSDIESQSDDIEFITKQAGTVSTTPLSSVGHNTKSVKQASYGQKSVFDLASVSTFSSRGKESKTPLTHSSLFIPCTQEVKDISSAIDIGSDSSASLLDDDRTIYNSDQNSYSELDDSEEDLWQDNNDEIDLKLFRVPLWKSVVGMELEFDKDGMISIYSHQLAHYVCLPSPPHVCLLKPEMILPYVDTDQGIFLRDLENGPKFDIIEYTGPIDYAPVHLKPRLALTSGTHTNCSS